jgi:phosphoglycolate phosphatase-like HAD superfamily hydrolase
MQRRSLLLFDCDGSLFAGEDELALSCFGDALSELSGFLWPPEVFAGCDPARTARGVARDLGVDPDAWAQRVLELYFDGFDERAAAGWHVHDGVEPTLRSLLLCRFQLALFSARPEAIVRFRLERLGIGGYFPHGSGAFGCEADAREDLLRLALWRSAATPRRAVFVSDASADVRLARRLGLTTIAVELLSGLPALLGERPAAA